MSDTISIPKVNGYAMSELQTQLDSHATPNKTISNNGFFPDIALNEVRNKMRLDGTVTNDRLEMAVVEAIASVNDELRHFQQEARESDRTFADLEGEQINGESILAQRYKRAVFCLATANINERYRAFDTTKDGNDLSDKLETTVGDLRRDARFAIQDILGKSRVTVRLL